MKVLFYRNIGYLPYHMYELKTLQNGDFMLRDVPLVINGQIELYEEHEQTKLCYLFDDLLEYDQEIVKSIAVDLKENKDGTYSILDQEGVKVKDLK